MYIATFVLFLIPWSILAAAWFRFLHSQIDVKLRHPRWYLLIASLVIGTVCVAADMASWFSWFHNGGSPHGLLPSPGIWMRLRPVIKYSFIATPILATFAKGRGKLLVVASAFSLVFVEFALGALEMD
jgi:hypothetical protein